MVSWTELTSLCPACESHALRLATDGEGKKWNAVVYGCVMCRLFWVRGDQYWIEEDSAADLAELLGRPRESGVTLLMRKRIFELSSVRAGSTGR